MTPSPYQVAILDAVDNTTANLLIQACAGSGKTTTIKLACQRIMGKASPFIESPTVLVLAFNKSIATELQAKLPEGAKAQTFHSLGLAACRASKRCKPNDRKQYYIAKELVEKDATIVKDRGQWNQFIQKATSLAINLCLPYDAQLILEVVDRYGINIPKGDHNQKVDAAALVLESMRRGRADTYGISYDDMLDHPVQFDYSFPKYDVVLVDESQDLNPIQHKMLSMIAGKDSRVIAVGDARQAIYAFRGAHSNSMDLLKERFDMTELPLSVCYRCGTAIVAEAQKVVGPEIIQPWEQAAEGQVTWCKDYVHGLSAIANLGTTDPNAMVLCRTNAPLVGPCFSLLRRRVKAYIKGRDIGQGLINLVEEIDDSYQKYTEPLSEDSSRTPTSDTKMTYMEYVDKDMVNRLSMALKKDDTSKVAMLEDQLATIQTIAGLVEGEPTPAKIIMVLEEIFSDTKDGICFSSIHRSKGLEAATVVYLCYDKVPHPLAKGAEALIQEKNLDYVAKTRAILHLIMVPSPDFEGSN